MQKLNEVSEYRQVDNNEEIEKFFGNAVENPDDKCSINKLSIQNNVISIRATDLGNDNNYNPGF